MNTDYLKNFSMMTNEMQKPLQEMIALNMKTLQSVKIFRLEELTNLRQPEEFFEKQVNLAIQNSHSLLDYVQKSFQILESAYFGFSHELSNHAEKTIGQAQEELMRSSSPFSQPLTKTRKKKTATTAKRAVKAQKKAIGKVKMETKGILGKVKKATAKKTAVKKAAGLSRKSTSAGRKRSA